MPADVPPAPFAPMPALHMGTCMQRAFNLYTKEMGWFIGAGLAYSAVEALATAASAGWALLLGLVLLTPASMGLYALASGVARGESPSFGHLLTGFKDPRAYALGAAQTALVLGGLLLFVVPGLVAVVALIWCVPALHRRDIGAWDAVRRSFALTREHLGLTLVVVALALVLNSLGTGTVLLGAFTAPFLVCLKLVLFEQLDSDSV